MTAEAPPALADLRAAVVERLGRAAAPAAIVSVPAIPCSRRASPTGGRSSRRSWILETLGVLETGRRS
ncbi:hypothetical protein [Rathayibacter oskolensis]|uniref:hypothetical protein n=1 Tax=Rathayibacter oskolensis TaxID=1891671 RepID=UPI003465FDB2